MMSRNLPSSQPKVLLIGSGLSENFLLRIRAWLEKAGGKVGRWILSRGNGGLFVDENRDIGLR